MDTVGQFITNLIVGKLDSEAASKYYLIYCKPLEIKTLLFLLLWPIHAQVPIIAQDCSVIKGSQGVEKSHTRLDVICYDKSMYYFAL